jgi:hypothetical protein
MKWGENIEKFIKLANKNEVRMILVGGGAVNFHGYQRHSADVDFWIDTSRENMVKLVRVFNEMGYEIEEFPDTVMNKMQNISIKFTPYDLDLELITRFSVGKSFDEAYQESSIDYKKEQKLLRWNILSYEDLITSKVKSSRPKDLLDIQQLKQNQENQ